MPFVLNLFCGYDKHSLYGSFVEHQYLSCDVAVGNSFLVILQCDQNDNMLTSIFVLIHLFQSIILYVYL
jgi:hypothetical protein